MNKTIKSYTDDMNIEYKLYLNVAGKGCLRAFDLDCGEVVMIKIFTALDLAEKAYDNLISNLMAPT